MASKSIYNLPSDAVWFITGCSSGIGLALAQLIAAHPTHRLVATARDPATLTQVLPTDSPRVHTFALDVVEETSITAALNSAITVFGRIDVLVNNAGIGLMGDTESALQPEDHAKARQVLETNFWGTANLSLQAIRIFRDENPKTGQQGGVVLNVSSIGGFVAFPGSTFYHSAKFAVEGFTEGISKEVRPEWNIHFSIMQPGGTQSNFATVGIRWFSTHAAYEVHDSPSRAITAFMKDPEIAKTFATAETVAAAMYRTVSQGRPIPLHVPLGEVAWNVVKNEADQVSKALGEIKELSFSADSSALDENTRFLQKALLPSPQS